MGRTCLAMEKPTEVERVPFELYLAPPADVMTGDLFNIFLAVPCR